MDDIQFRIEQAQHEVRLANERLKEAILARREAGKAGLPPKDFKKAEDEALQCLHAAEVRLRTLYEAKGDWVSLTPIGSVTAAPAPVATS